MIIKICIVFISLVTLACQKKSDINVHMPKTHTPTPMVQQQEPTQGTVDGGGCNGIHGLCLEAYQQDIVQFPEYQKYIQPILDRLHRKLPIFATNLEYIANKRSWYFIPEKLKNITSNKLEVAFATEQVALQGMFEIWIDKKMYKEMSLEKRAKLLLHEMLMGNKILEFHNFFEICNANSSNLMEIEYCSIQENIYKSNSAFAEIGKSKDKIKIEAQDYLAIREITNALLSNKEPQATDGLVSWLNNLKHREYKTPPPTYFWLLEEHANINPKSLNDFLELNPNFSIQYGYLNFIYQNNTKYNYICEFNHSYEKENKSLKITLTAHDVHDSNIRKVFNFDIKETADEENPYYEINQNILKGETSLTFHSYQNEDQRDSINFTFYGHSFISAHIEKSAKKDGYWDQNSDFKRQGEDLIFTNLVCLNKPKLKLIDYM